MKTNKINELSVRVLFLQGIIEAQRQQLRQLKKQQVIYSPYIPEDMARRIKSLCQRVGPCKTTERLLEWLQQS